MEKIVVESSIWDLHIHTCDCPKGTDEFSKMNVNDYVDNLVKIFNNYPNLKMIAFTDHNYISKRVFEEFSKRKTGVSVLPAVEVDVYLYEKDEKEKNDNYKHLIFYYDNKKFNWDIHPQLINNILKDGPIYIYNLLNSFIEKVKDLPFLISPHFLKQNERGIDYDWIDDCIVKENLNKYLDQLFCFWESSGIKNINNAVKFLIDYDKGDKKSIINFSDSNKSEKLINYLKNPNQFFNALPNFEGLRMVGSDFHRITKEYISISAEDKGKYIGKIIQDGKEILLSHKLNAIIGGRGSGKSLFIDGIAMALKKDFKEKKYLDTKREDFIEKLDFSIYNMHNEKMCDCNFKIDYYNQGFVLKMFENGDNVIDSKYFKDEFDKISTENASIIKTKIIESLSYEEKILQTTNENISAISLNVKYLSNQKNDFIFAKSQENKKIEYNDINDVLNSLNKPSITPKELVANTEIMKAKYNLIEIILKEQNKLNLSRLSNNINYYLKTNYKKKIEELNNDRKKKSDIIDLIKKDIRNNSLKTLNRVSIINAILKLDNKYSKNERNDVKSYENRKFIFEKKLIVQNFVDYLHKILINYIDSNKFRIFSSLNKNNIDSLWELINLYCFDLNKVIMDSKNENDLDDELSNLKNLAIYNESNIYYFDGHEERNIGELSPGTQANLLMEYIVFKETDIPLLIDQPEDNIDNRTIYNVLTKWFESLKANRQVIVATHDPNIVVNADAENIIICNQINKNKFDYRFGAMEYSDNIEQIANILDGGKLALERRLVKYGEN